MNRDGTSNYFEENETKRKGSSFVNPVSLLRVCPMELTSQAGKTHIQYNLEALSESKALPDLNVKHFNVVTFPLHSSYFTSDALLFPTWIYK